MAPRRPPAGVVVHKTYTPPSPPEGKARAISGDAPGLCELCGGPRSGRGCCRETIGPTLKTGVASWPGMRSFTLPRSSERYSGVGWKEHELGQQPECLRTPDFGAPLPEWPEVLPSAP